MVTSTQLTDAVNRSPNPKQALSDLWSKARYLVAQVPAGSEEDTYPGYYRGRVVIPGPKANPEVSEVLSENDIDIVMKRNHITFIDNNTTENADQSMRRANYTIMSNAEADDYEKLLKKEKKKYESSKPKSEGASSPPA